MRNNDRNYPHLARVPEFPGMICNNHAMVFSDGAANAKEAAFAALGSCDLANGDEPSHGNLSEDPRIISFIHGR